MTRRGGGIRGALRIVAALLALAAAAGCGGPFMVFPGGALSGEVASPPPDWTPVDSAFMDLELRPEDPYSVTVNYFVKEGKLYVDPDPERTWAKYLAEDDRVRVRFGFDDRVYPLRAVKVSDAGEPFMDFDPARSVYRLDPR